MNTQTNDEFSKDFHVVNNPAVVSTPAVHLTDKQLAAAYEYEILVQDNVTNFTNYK